MARGHRPRYVVNLEENGRYRLRILGGQGSSNKLRAQVMMSTELTEESIVAAIQLADEISGIKARKSPQIYTELVE